MAEAEARRLKAGRWRLYKSPGYLPVRGPKTGNIVSFDSFEAARYWWMAGHPEEATIKEAVKCARCGAYFGPSLSRTSYAGRLYHPSHVPPAVDLRLRGLE
jgi:hypothetical protein